jgi:branched-chain amino acid aminotransferase
MKIAQETLRRTGQRKFGVAHALKVQKASTLKETPRDLSMTTDHMLCVEYSDAKGWEAPEIKPYGTIKVHTTATVLHYGMSCFDGFIVARNRDTGKLQAKDLDKHIDRLNAASRHLDLPAYDKD